MWKLAQKLAVACIFLVLFLDSLDAKDLGKLDCTENDGMKPDSKLLNLIISKCQPKQGQSEETVGACLIKCLMKQQKALDKKGKLKIKKAAEVIHIFPEKFHDKVSARFEECANEHNPNLKKEPNGCESWLPFSNCFFSYSRALCPTEKQRKEMANGNSTIESTSTGTAESTTVAP